MRSSDDADPLHEAEPQADREPTLFEWAGGSPALLRMTRIFYGKYVPEDPLLAPLFAEMAPDHPERVAAWLGETFGGPKAYTEAYGGYDRMVSRHRDNALSEEQRARWVQLLCKAADDAGWTEVSDTYQAPARAAKARVELRLLWAPGGRVEWGGGAGPR